MSNLPIIQLRNIVKEFYQGSSLITVINGIDLTIYPGELIAIIGSSGSGKSTLLQMMGLLDRTSSGEIIFEGEKIDKLSLSAREKIRLEKLGFVYQSHNLLRDFTAQENVMMPGLIAGEKYAQLIIKANDLLKQLGIFEQRFNFPSQLSGGEQQRVAIARALFNAPALLLADEPTGNLDPKTGNEVFELLLKLIQVKSLSAVVVTHNHQLAQKANKVFKLTDGHLRCITGDLSTDLK